FFTTSARGTALPVRRKDLEDSPIPSGNAASAFGLLRLGLLSGEPRYEHHALSTLRLLFPLAVRHPLAFGHLLRAADFHLATVHEVAVVGQGPEAEALLRVVRERYRPHVVLAGGAEDGVPLMRGRHPVDGHAAAYVCEHFTCQAPVTTPEELATALS
ncbi:MAG TPA: thioredoxin domain-containing protein, partial [Solirubrobacteraceae bacterium]|nr:thioredoxin domain-containing protein [Solirubrobacteraceae bacterium]